MSTPSAGYTLGGASTATTAPLPTANTIDATQDVLPIYTASLTSTQGINRNTLLGITGSPVGNTDSQTLTNKTIGVTNTITQKDGSFTLQNTADITKQVQWSLASITAGNTRTITVPDSSLTLVGTTTTQTLTNKTLTSPIINAPTITNATISTDSVTGFSVANTGTIYGMAVTTGTIGNAALAANSVNTSQITTGIQLPDKMKNPYKFSVYRNAAQNTGTGGFALLACDTKIFDTGSNVDVVTNKGRFTAPIAGFYQFSAAASSATGGAANHTLAINLYKNGVSFVVGSSAPTWNAAAQVQVSCIIQLAANDYVEAYVYGDIALALSVGSAGAVFNGFLVSAT